MKRNKKVQVVLWITLFFNLLVSGIKIIVGYITHINSITADGYHSLADASGNIIGLISMKVASKPVDSDHAYGHQRYETLATLFIVVMLVLLGFEVVKNAILNFYSPQTLTLNTTTVAIIMFALFINIIVATYQNTIGKRLKSSLLIADAKHTLSDIYISIGVLINLILLLYFNFPYWIDGVTSLFIAVVIFKTAYGIFKESSKELTDAIAIDPKRIEKKALENPLVQSIHKIRSRKSGNLVFIDFHVQTDPSISLVDAHNLSHQLEESLQEAFDEDISVIVHVEPKGYHYTPKE